MATGKNALFSVIDIEAWKRREYCLHYHNDFRCTYSITANIDITKIYNRANEGGFRLYPVLIWRIANAVNHFDFLRFNHDEEGRGGYYGHGQSFHAAPKRQIPCLVVCL